MLDILRHFRRNWGYRLLAIILGLSIWMYVTGEKNPIGETVIRVPLETQNLGEELVIADNPTSVQVRVEGRKIIINSLVPRDIHAYVDMGHARAGGNLLPIQVEVPSGVNVININPAEAEIAVEKIEQAEFPVQVNLTGAPAGGFQVLEPLIKPSQVMVSGPSGMLKDIGQVYVEANIDQTSGNYVNHFPVKLTNKQGQSLGQWVNISPPAIEVLIPIIRDMPAKMLAIKPQLVGEIAEGYVIERIIMQPEVIEVFAPYNQLALLDYINTAPIDIEGLKKEIIRETTLEIPTGIQVGAFPEVRVIIEIVKLDDVN